MKGFNYSIPLGMIFQKHYCSKCGEKLKKEKTHRVVSKDDKDYYRYHDYGSYPKIDYNVYEYIFLCPSCQTRITYHEQRVIKKIQKIEKSKILSKYQLQENFQKCKAWRGIWLYFGSSR
jgi:transcription initiation factor IIE alpha subunit